MKLISYFYLQRGVDATFENPYFWCFVSGLHYIAVMKNKSGNLIKS